MHHPGELFGPLQQITNLFNIKIRAKKVGEGSFLASPDNKGKKRGNIVLILLTPYPLEGGQKYFANSPLSATLPRPVYTLWH